ncbi:rhomboid family intramembrane serine protease [Vibrio metschnikovii]
MSRDSGGGSLTGNFTHTNFAHLGMNLAGLWVIVFLFMPSIKSLFFALIMLSLSVDKVSFTEMTLYVGLSGVLHGLFAYFALLEWLNGRRSNAWHSARRHRPFKVSLGAVVREHP